MTGIDLQVKMALLEALEAITSAAKALERYLARH